MKSTVLRPFWKSFERLPRHVQVLAKSKYLIWRDDPTHPSLRFKPLKDAEPVWSIAVGRGHRALGRRRDIAGVDTVEWWWIGTHEEYNNLIAQL